MLFHDFFFSRQVLRQMRKLNWDDSEVCIVSPVVSGPGILGEHCIVSIHVLKGCSSATTKCFFTLGLAGNDLYFSSFFISLWRVCCCIVSTDFAGIHYNKQNSLEYPLNTHTHMKRLRLVLLLLGLIKSEVSVVDLFYFSFRLHFTPPSV